MRLAAAVCLAAAVLMARPGRARLRLRSQPPASVRTAVVGRQGKLTPTGSSPRAPLLLAAGGGTILIAFGPAVALGVGAVAAASLGLRQVAGARRSGEDQVALSIDLLGASMACGALPAVALAAIAPALSGQVGEVLAEAATALSLGADPAAVWAQVGADVPPLDRAARACARTASSGASVADELFRLAAVARSEAQVRRRRRLERAGVWLVLPLGLCFLPAFVLVAVVPVVLSATPALAR